MTACITVSHVTKEMPPKVRQHLECDVCDKHCTTHIHVGRCAAPYTQYTTLHRPGGQRGRPDSVARGGRVVCWQLAPATADLCCAHHISAHGGGVRSTRQRARRRRPRRRPHTTHDASGRVHPPAHHLTPTVLDHVSRVTCKLSPTTLNPPTCDEYVIFTHAAEVRSRDKAHMRRVDTLSRWRARSRKICVKK